jgi:hypothetical protein
VRGPLTLPERVTEAVLTCQSDSVIAAVVVKHADAISHGVAGVGRSNDPVVPASARAARTASLTAKYAHMERQSGVSPVVLLRITPTGLGQSGSNVV